MRITYRRASPVKIGERYVKGVLISDEDVRLLRLLSSRDFSISLECLGQPTYHVRIRQLLKRIVPDRKARLWFVATTLTGPLRRSGAVP